MGKDLHITNDGLDFLRCHLCKKEDNLGVCDRKDCINNYDELLPKADSNVELIVTGYNTEKEILARSLASVSGYNSSISTRSAIENRLSKIDKELTKIYLGIAPTSPFISDNQ